MTVVPIFTSCWVTAKLTAGGGSGGGGWGSLDNAVVAAVAVFVDLTDGAIIAAGNDGGLAGMTTDRHKKHSSYRDRSQLYSNGSWIV